MTTADGPQRKSVLRDYAETILVCVIFVLFARAFVFQQSKIPTGSMEDTLLPGDYILVDRMHYAPVSFSWESRLLPGRPIERGDIIVFRYPEAPEVDYIKRVIALPGDTVEVRDREVRVNGSLLDEAYVTEAHRSGYYPEAAPQTVAPDRYFVLGDHRNDSLDSREWGLVPASHVKGRAVLIWWSFPENDGAHPTLSQRLRAWGGKIVGFFTKTRWNRCLKRIR
ncbi:MAG: signal peptidase I [Acidobacteria bacterium]|nr:signal peptidase I [Acidobacteriota bacterium]NIM63963.1 signal peptidase I [Acidobacteriota bacterium]NIO59368.1 signal peptidase I [Acidobacteriota bacterium]NIQ30404.1 signal peptidase I [Acidobacteriota bacterium]NIQ85330.1 signal peptidase I [Acidobacteriota bacterium]